MIAIPAVDLRDGACVQLVGGSYAEERVRLHDPVAVARHWTGLGFHRLHVVDLDAATRRGDNGAVVERILGDAAAEVQVGGGVRSTERVESLLAAGARRVVVGTRAIESPEWLDEIARRHAERVIVAADVRERRVVADGWDRALTLDVTTLVSTLSSLPLAGILVTAVHVEGSMRGPDLSLVEEVARLTPHPLIASGGVGSVDDLRALDRCGAAGAVIGMALYTGAVDASAVAEEFGS